MRIVNSNQDNVLQYCIFEWSRQIANYPDENSRGGALYANSSLVRVENCHFRFCSATGMGGAACFYRTRGSLLGNHFDDNFGFTEIVWVYESDMPAIGNQFINNRGDYGAGLILDGSHSPVENNVFRHNLSGIMTWGGALYLVHGSRSVVRQNLIVDNTGGGVFIGYDAFPLVFEHNTIANNRGHSGIFVVNGGRMIASNSIIWGNGGGDIQLSNGSAQVDYSNVGQTNGVERGEGVINANPLFRNSADGDYRLDLNSPCWNSGDPNAQRDPDGTRADMGRYMGPQGIAYTPLETIDFGLLRRGEEATRNIWITYVEGDLRGILLTLQINPEDSLLSASPAEEIIEVGDTLWINLHVRAPRGALMGRRTRTLGIHVEEHPSPAAEFEIIYRIGPGREPEPHRIPLEPRWSLISTYTPPPDPAFDIVWQDVLSRGNVALIKDGMGRFLVPNQFNNMVDFDVRQGYWVRMSARDTLSITNIPVDFDLPIPLRRGWNLVAYFPEAILPAEEAFQNSQDNIIIAKDASGRFYLPDRGFNMMPDLRRGKGYLVKAREADSLVWFGGQEVNGIPRSPETTPFHAGLEATSTGVDMSLLLEKIDGVPVDGCELVAFVEDERVVGSILLPAREYLAQSQLIGLPIRGDDPTTPEVDGARYGDVIHFRLHAPEGEWTLAADYTTGSSRFEGNELAVAALRVVDKVGALPSGFALSAHPNPFNSSALITFSLDAVASVELGLFDLRGRRWRSVIEGTYPAGMNTLVLEAGELPAGIYLLRLSAGGEQKGAKIALVR